MSRTQATPVFSSVLVSGPAALLSFLAQMVCFRFSTPSSERSNKFSDSGCPGLTPCHANPDAFLDGGTFDFADRPGYEMVEVLGKGSVGKVLRATRRRENRSGAKTALSGRRLGGWGGPLPGQVRTHSFQHVRDTAGMGHVSRPGRRDLDTCFFFFGGVGTYFEAG